VTYIHRHGKKIAVDTISSSSEPTKRHKPFEVRFVKLPCRWIEQLQESNNPGTFKLAHRILMEDFRRQNVGREIILSTEATGLSRKVRSRAVKELLGLGLIEVEQHGNQAARVINLLLPEKKRRRE
jgi:hypothetical protein